MLQTQEKQIVLKAIDELGRSVTPADVATKTGLPILKATAELNKIAAETEGHLEVATTGDIAYKFDPGFQNAYLKKGIEKSVNDVIAGTLKVGFFLLRISFGVMLIVSFILVIVLIVAAIIAMMTLNSQRDDGDSGDFNFSFDFFDFMILRDLLWWSSYSTVPTYSDWGNYGGSKSTYIDYDRPSTRTTPKKNFFYNCFSFLFGDGNPNLNIEERKWQYIAQLIKHNNGVATAEQLAPYTGADPKNEDGVLPVLVRFDGMPQVTESGHIIYQFPSLQVSAAHGHESKLPKYLREFKWEFTQASPSELMPVYILAGVNLLGSWWLLLHIGYFAHVLAPLILALATYGTFFLVVPGIRALVLQQLNSRIEARNNVRSEYAIVAEIPSKELAAKLMEAKQLRIGEKHLTEKDVVYRTDKDALEQEFDASP